jgi:hypothetical protein
LHTLLAKFSISVNFGVMARAALYEHLKTDSNGIQIGHEVAVMQWQKGKKKCVWPTRVANTKLLYAGPKWKEK